MPSLRQERSAARILHCLGYRMDPAPELVFETPESVHSPQTLQTLLAADIGKAYGGGHPLDFRFRLARQISEAVLTVHTAKLVHKNIRTETILILRPANAGSDESARLATGFGQEVMYSFTIGSPLTTMNAII